MIIRLCLAVMVITVPQLSTGSPPASFLDNITSEFLGSAGNLYNLLNLNKENLSHVTLLK